MPICKTCQGFVTQLFDRGHKSEGRLRPPLDPAPLRESAKKCEFCTLISREHEYLCAEADNNSDGKLSSRQIVLTGETSITYNHGVWFNDGFHSITGIWIRIGGERYKGFAEPKSWLRVYAKQDSAAAIVNQISGRQLLSSPSSPTAFRLVNNWIARCLSDPSHEKCRQTIDGEAIDETIEPRLPTRVIDVGPRDGSQEPRLLETKSSTGFYVALSHCWGSPDKRPLTTTSLTLADHLKCIPYEKLPKTFREAVSVTREIGLRYLWIDSLCIVQDDDKDWRQESAVMGSVYHNARLTIASSFAADSTEGCFVDRPPPPERVEIPVVTKSGDLPGSIFVSADRRRGAVLNPDNAPLNQRAWVTQEWILSRRTIHYMKESLVWSCKFADHFYYYLAEDETGRPIEIQYRNKSWSSIVESYTSRQLTYRTDQLIALQGVVSEIQAFLPYKYYKGMWLGDALPHQLLWTAGERLKSSPESLRIPSWSWASTVGRVVFISDVHEVEGRWLKPHRGWDVLIGDINIGDDGELCTSGQLKTAGRFRKCMDLHMPVQNLPPLKYASLYPQSVVDHADMPFLRAEFEREGSKVYHFLEELRTNCLYMILDHDGERIGLAGFDRGIMPEGPILCFPVLAGNHSFRGPYGCYMLLLSPSNHVYKGRPQKSLPWWSPASCCPPADRGKNIGGRPSYRRVGVGWMFQTNWFDGAKRQEVVIV